MDNTHHVMTLPKGPQNLIFFLLFPGILLFVCKRAKKSFSHSFPPNDMAIVASSSSAVINNEVFISFRGDTRKNFTSHLYSVLCRKGIQTYRDDPNLERGDEISPALSRAIEESMISIVVFSKEYASSRWCLDELVHILKCKNERAQIVLPVFYNIDPSDIRKQQGSYAIAFAAHEERFELKKVEEWRNALTAAADLSGFHLQDQALLE
ncbi:TMV resistance protein N [Morus notabilis]|uniref:TMV resistance protein N n=1 Tax=Morus notabilis TaxID=981085 RepID=UPI000CED083E|nr:TMV resistance protein N [Morus notabilis]